jgi:hypothetical protein
MSQGFWEFNLISGKNPTHTGAFLTGYDQRTFTQEEVVAREGGQNASDAGRNIDGITQLIFQKLSAKGEKKDKLVELLQLNTALEPRLGVFKNEERNRLFASSVKEFLDGDELNAILIRDFKTCGLGGKWDAYGQTDHFARLVCALNLDDKADGNSSSGGSYGLGKTAFAKSSKINTVVYHSVFTPSEKSADTHRRLMVSGIYPKHELDGTSYGGFAYFGKPASYDGTIAAPFEDLDAEDLWSQIASLFGANLSRSKAQTGTDILVLVDTLDMQLLKKAVEDYYFPALISNDLSVTFISEDGSTDQPAVLARSDLDQFVKLYKKARSKEVIKEEQLTVDAFNKRNGRAIGRFAYQAAEPDEAVSPKNNCVAIMRGTGMVINYEKVGGDQYEPAVGVYIAHDDVHEYLQTSENSAHSEWSEHSHRLNQKFPEEGKSIVSHVNSVIKRRFIEFQKNLQPDVSISKSENGLLARLLTGALSGTKGDGGPGPKNYHNPVSLSLTQKKREDDLSIWKLKIMDCDHTPEAPFSLTLLPSISLAGEKNIPIKHLDFVVKDEKGAVLHSKSDPKMQYNFSKGMGLDFVVEIPNPGRKNYVVQCKCIAENGDFDAV